MSRKEIWEEMVKDCKEAVEDFNDFPDDRATIWADNELKNYKRAMLILANSHRDWVLNVNEDDEKFVSTMIRRTESC